MDITAPPCRDALSISPPKEELTGLKGRLDILGFYYKIMEEDEFRTLSADPKSVDKFFHELARQRLVNWVDLAEERLNGTGIKCFVTGGNDDEWDVLSAIKERRNKILLCL